MSDRDELLNLIKSDAVVHGKVVLSSGKQADYYVDLRRVTLSSAAAPLVGTVMLELTADLDFDAVGGLTLGADPVAAAMLHAASRAGTGIDLNIRAYVPNSCPNFLSASSTLSFLFDSLLSS